MKGIFISYRRSDTGSPIAGRISDFLSSRYGADLVYFDIQDIKPGQDFDVSIDEALSQCHSFVIVIDRHWVHAEQLQRLHNSDDYVRREIAAALGSDVLTLPVTIEDTTMPAETSLPDSLKSLCFYQALPLRHTTFNTDMGAIAAALDEQYAELEALKNAMPCPHCHNPISLSPGERLTTCPSCHAGVGVMRMVLEGRDSPGKNSDLSRQLQLAAIDFSSERYHEAFEQYERIVESFPECWEALTNKAICLFWIGSEDLGHLPEVFGLLEKSDLLSNGHPKVHATRRSLAYNLAALAGKEEMVGESISWSLDLFDSSLVLEPNDPNRDEIITDYIERCFDGIQKRLLELLMRDRKNFDPPLAELASLSRLMYMGGSVDLLRFFCVMADRKMQVGQASSALVEDLKLAQQKLNRISPTPPPLRLIFPFIGDPKIEET